MGEASYQDNLWRLVGGRSSIDDRVRVDVHAVLAAEPDNLYDANAIAVWVQGLKVGYLSREDARRLGPGLLALEQRHADRALGRYHRRRDASGRRRVRKCVHAAWWYS